MSKKSSKPRSKATVTAKAAPAKKTKRAKAVVITTPAVHVGGERQERNGIKEPGKGVCRDVWNALDKMLAGGMVPTSKDVKDLAAAKSWNETNATIELGRWRKFHGLSRPVKVATNRKTVAKAAPPATRTDGSVDQHAA